MKARTKAAKKAVAKKTRPAIDLQTLVGQFSDALALLEVAIMSFGAAEDRGYPELVVLERGLGDLKAVYTELDRMSGAS
jgi:hypothetical protein